MKDTEKKLAEIMGSQFKQKTQHAAAICDYILGQPKRKRPGLVEFLFTNFGLVGERRQQLQSEPMSHSTWELFQKTLSRKIVAQLAKIIKPSLSTKDIAAKLWEYVETFKTRDQKIFCLVKILASDQVPLLTDEERVGAITMTDKQYAKLIDKPKIRKLLDVILNIKIGGFSKWPEMAGAMLYQLDQAKTLEEKLVIMICALAPAAPNPGYGKDFPGAEKFSNRLFNKYLKVAKLKIQSLIKIQHSPFFTQRPETAGAILNLISQEPVKEARVVLMSALLEQASTATRSSDFGGLLTELLGTEKCAKCEHLDCPEHPRHAEAVAP